MTDQLGGTRPDPSTGKDTVRIYLGPEQPEELQEAITGAGGTLTDPSEAEAIVWYGAGPSELPDVLAPGVRWIQLPSAGVEPWLAADVLPADAVVTSATGAYATTVAEHTLALLLAGARRLHDLARARTWTSPLPTSLRDATVVVVGAGGIGRALIELLEPLGARVVAITRSGREVEGADESVGPDGMPDALGQADYVVLTAPATAETEHLIGAGQLAAMKPSAWLVNVSRGTLVDTEALVEALRQGDIGGAALDVTDPEPLPDDHPLWAEPGVLITPHTANPDSLLLPRLAERVAENVERYLAGEDLVGEVDRDRGY